MTTFDLAFLALANLTFGGMQLSRYMDKGGAARLPMAAITLILAVFMAFLAVAKMGQLL